MAILANHQNGRDTHIRQIKIYTPRRLMGRHMDLPHFSSVRAPARATASPTSAPTHIRQIAPDPIIGNWTGDESTGCQLDWNIDNTVKDPQAHRGEPILNANYSTCTDPSLNGRVLSMIVGSYCTFENATFSAGSFTSVGWEGQLHELEELVGPPPPPPPSTRTTPRLHAAAPRRRRTASAARPEPQRVRSRCAPPEAVRRRPIRGDVIEAELILLLDRRHQHRVA